MLEVMRFASCVGQVAENGFEGWVGGGLTEEGGARLEKVAGLDLFNVREICGVEKLGAEDSKNELGFCGHGALHSLRPLAFPAGSGDGEASAFVAGGACSEVVEVVGVEVDELNAEVAVFLNGGSVRTRGTVREMGVGLPKLYVLTEQEFLAVLAHEFDHYLGGGTKLGAWIYKTRAVLENSLAEFGEESWLRLPFQWYARVFLRITSAVSRQEEYAADAAGARGGSGPTGEWATRARISFHVSPGALVDRVQARVISRQRSPFFWWIRRVPERALDPMPVNRGR
jgi:hypothetical protein